MAGALGEALVELERAHPEAVAGLFDEVFLKSDAAAFVLADCLVPGGVPTAEHLVAAWFAHTGATAGDAHAGDVVESAAECLLVAFDRALDQRDRQNVLGELRAYRANRISADAISQFASWTGSQRRRSRIDPQQRYGELDLDRFAGRAWLVEQIDEFLRECDGGYFELEGAAGVGKSTFLAWLARERGYPVHFVQLNRGRDDTAAALSNLALQLADAWEVDGPVSLHGPDVEPHEFYELLTAITRTRQRRRRSDPVVIVIDGLDEVRATHKRGNVLGLPARPPDGVYIIVSRRPVHVDLNVHWSRCCALRIDDERHLQDLRAYLTAACTRPKIERALRRAQLPDEEFIDALMDKSAGVWLYLHHVLRDIEQGTRDVSQLDDLPVGIWAFYEEHVRDRAHVGARWEDYELVLLSTLAAAQEPLEQPALAMLAGVQDRAAVDEVIDAWAPFLERDGASPYWLYHDSLRRFFAGEAGPELSASQRRLANRFAEATGAAHERIADRYLQLWGGLAGGLSGLRESSRAMAEDGYGVRQLAAHLEIRERYDELRALLQVEWTGPGRPLCAWYEAHAQAGDHTRYLTDVERARRLAEARSDRALAGSRPAVTLADEYGYALLAGSMRAQSTRIAPQLRRALVHRGIWSVTRAVADVQQLIDQADRGVRLAVMDAPISRAHALAALAEFLDADQLDDALHAAIGDDHGRARVLVMLAKHLDADQLNDALQAAREIDAGDARARVLVALAEHLNADQLNDALLDARAIGDQGARAHALTVLAKRLDADQRERALDDALQAARQIGDKSARVRALAALAKDLDADQRERALNDALQAGCTIGIDLQRAGALAALAPHLDADQLDDALQAARAIRNGDARAGALGVLAWYVDTGQRERTLNDALQASSAINIEHARVGAHLDAARLNDGLQGVKAWGCEFARAEALNALAWRLDADQLNDALEAASAMDWDVARGRALAALAPHLDAEQLTSALQATFWTRELDARARALAALAEHLDADQLTAALQAAHAISDIDALAEHLDADQLIQALQAARAIGDGHGRAGALASLASYLPADQRERALDDALRAAAMLPADYTRAIALTELARHLNADQLTDALKAAAPIDIDDARAVVLGALAERLDTDQLTDALQAARPVSDERACVLALRVLAEHLDADQLTDALQIAAAIGDEHERSRALAALAEHLDADQLTDALQIAAAIGDEHERSRALAALAEHLDADQLTDALQAVYAIGTTNAHADTFVALPRQDVDHRERALKAAFQAARAIGNDEMRGRALGVLAKHLDTDQLTDALQTAVGIGDEHERARALGVLAKHLDADQLTDALQAARTIGDESQRADALTALAEYLDADQLTDALQATAAISNDYICQHALVTLVKHLDADQLTDALQAARTIDDESHRADALTALAGHLHGDQRRRALNDALRAAAAISVQIFRVNALKALVEYLDADQLNDALQAVRAIGHDDAPTQVALMDQLLLKAPELSVQDQFLALWREAVHLTQHRGRSSVLAVAPWTGHIVHRTGGSDAVASTVAWIGTTSRWWP